MLWIKNNYILTIALSFAWIVSLGQTKQLTLDLQWQLESLDTAISVPGSVPGCVHLDLMKSGVIEDPFYGNNESKVQWIADKSWQYTSEPFSLDPSILGSRQLQLNFNCLDTYADVWLNGTHILSADNYFREWNVAVNDLLNAQGNLLKVVFTSPLQAGEDLLISQKHALPGEPIRAVSRKPQFHYGWDWGPKLTTCGIQGEIKLTYSDSPSIENVWLKQVHSDNGSAQLHCFMEYTCPDSYAGEVEVRLADLKVAQSFEVKSGRHLSHQILDIPSSFPKWWPAGYGTQAIHELTFLLKSEHNEVLDKKVTRTGIRDVQLLCEKDSLGSSFSFLVNGTPIFMKGANYIPQDIFQTRVQRKDYEETLQSASDCGMNMLRVWGGGIYESDEFYSLCDSLGILIWQDFMFACAMYPGNKEFAGNVKEEATFQVKRLSAHPCIALWCGNNESSEGWHRWGWQSDLGSKERKQIWKSYECIFREILPEAVDSFSSTPYWESSPSLGRGDPQHQFEGDAHYWGVWHDAEPFENFELKVPRFMSEFGFQSFPSMLSINGFAEKSNQKLDHPNIVAHEKHSRGIALINEYMLRDFGKIPDDFEEYVLLSQFVQAEGMRKGIDAHRMAQPYCMGTLYWQLNDCWPAASWSSIDDLGIWKPLHWIAKSSFRSTQLMHVVDSLTVKGYLVGDFGLKKEHLIELQFALIDFNGRTLYQETFEQQGSEESAQLLFSKNLSDLEGITLDNCFAQIKLMDGSHGLNLLSTFNLSAPKNLKLEPSNLILDQVEKDGCTEITIRSNTYVPRVWLFSDIAGDFSENYFPLLPGQTRIVTFNSEPGTLGTIEAKTMNDLLFKKN